LAPVVSGIATMLSNEARVSLGPRLRDSLLRVEGSRSSRALCTACCEDVPVLAQNDRIMYRLETIFHGTSRLLNSSEPI